MVIHAKAKDQTLLDQCFGEKECPVLRCIKEQRGGIVGKEADLHQEDHPATAACFLK